MPKGTADAALYEGVSDEQLARLRRDANEGGFTAFHRAFVAVFGPGVRTVWFRSGHGEIGAPPPRGVPFSDPPPKPIVRGKK